MLYLVLIGLALMAEVGSVLRCGFEKVLLENAFVEWASVATCAAALLLCTGVACADERRRALGLVLGGLALGACVREMDLFITLYVSERFYHALLGAVLLAVLAVAATRARDLWRQGMAFLQRPGFLLMLFGFVMAALWAKVLGQRKLWGYFGGVYPIDANGVKCMVEETLEWVGYLLILFGAFEERISSRKAQIEERMTNRGRGSQGDLA